MENHVATFHGSVYGKKATRKESDLPADLTNASAATRRVFEPTVSAAKLSATHRRSAVAKLFVRRSPSEQAALIAAASNRRKLRTSASVAVATSFRIKSMQAGSMYSHRLIKQLRPILSIEPAA